MSIMFFLDAWRGGRGAKTPSHVFQTSRQHREPNQTSAAPAAQEKKPPPSPVTQLQPQSAYDEDYTYLLRFNF